MGQFKRKVFYFHGFDARGPAFYKSFYTKQAARYTALTGEHVTVSPDRDGPATSAIWTVGNEAAGVETDYEFLRWEDVVERGWIRSPLKLFWKSLLAVDRHMVGHVRNLLKRPATKGQAVIVSYPLLFGLLLPVLFALIPALLLWIVLPFWAAALIGATVSALTVGRPLKKMLVPWLLAWNHYGQILATKGPSPVLDERLDIFARRVAQEMDGPWDEVLLFTHSGGTILVLPLLRRIVALRGGLPPHFTVIALGQVVPLVALRPDAHWYRDDVRALAGLSFHYVDLSYPPDAAASYGLDPLLLFNDAHAARVDLLSPRFHLFMDPEKRQRGFAGKYDAHFDYLRVGDRLSPIDYISLTAGPRTIDESIALFRALP
ncbi:MAG: hypothetical protein ABW039_04475 [Sphingobium sp.]